MHVNDLPEPYLTDNAKEVLRRRYLIKDETGEPIESPKDMFWRVACTIAANEKRYSKSPYYNDPYELAYKFYMMMINGYWLPNSPTLTGAGRDIGMLSACFVLPVEDTITNGKDGIFDTVRNAAVIMKAGGGVGYDFSRLRPANSIVGTTTGVASGPVSFMEIYNTAVEVMKQGGHRRGAQMGILRCDHPDILTFIDAKQDTSRLTNFNISVAVTDEFMEAVIRDEQYELKHQYTGPTGVFLSAREVFEDIVQNAWKTGEPGLFFVDQANRENPVPHIGLYESTNPCGEVPLLPYDVCNLGSLNLGKFVDNEGIPFFNFKEMSDYIKLSMRFLDNVIDVNNYPLAEIRDLSDKIRRVGNGVMGWADALIKLGIPYDSREALQWAKAVGARFEEECIVASQELANERGIFPEWENSMWGPNDNRKPTIPVRHCNMTTIAPTGTISILAGCSGGIEPLFAVEFTRNQAGTRMRDVHPLYESTLVHLRDVVFRTANEISPQYHVGMQAAWQNYIDAAVSKTINFANNADVESVAIAYESAWELGCKGITVYRDGSRPEQVLSTSSSEEAYCRNGVCAV